MSTSTAAGAPHDTIKGLGGQGITGYLCSSCHFICDVLHERCCLWKSMRVDRAAPTFLGGPRPARPPAACAAAPGAWFRQPVRPPARRPPSAERLCPRSFAAPPLPGHIYSHIKCLQSMLSSVYKSNINPPLEHWSTSRMSRDESQNSTPQLVLNTNAVAAYHCSILVT